MFCFDNRFQHRVALLGLALLFSMGSALLTCGEVRAQAPNMKNMPGMSKTKQETTASGTGTVTAVNCQLGWGAPDSLFPPCSRGNTATGLVVLERARFASEMRDARLGMRDIAVMCTMRTFDAADENIELSAEQIELGT